MKSLPVSVSILCLLALLLWSSPLHAVWPAEGTTVTSKLGDQWWPALTDDGAGGAFIAWLDTCTSEYHLYMRRIDAAGEPLWDPDGVPVHTQDTNPSYFEMLSDGTGGVIVVWHTNRNGNDDLYAQKIDASGAIQWTANGVAVCTQGAGQLYPETVSDGAGGVIAVWEDDRGDMTDIYAQRIDASGKPKWTTNGIPICTAYLLQENPVIASDGAGGAIIAWQDVRDAASYNIYAQRVDGAGAVQWTADGEAVSPVGVDQTEPHIVSDGVGGAVITWTGGSPWGLYVQRIDASGSALWTAGGVLVTTQGGEQRIASIGEAGAIITWIYGGTDKSVRAQRVDMTGAVRWTAGDVILCSSLGLKYNARIVPDGSYGAVITWEDQRTGSDFHFYAQKVDSSGTVLWTHDGVHIAKIDATLWAPRLATNGAGGAIVSWYDAVPGGNDKDIYAQMIDRYGRLGYIPPTIESVRDVPGDQGGVVYVSWDASAADRCMDSQMSHYSMWRAIAPAMALRAAGSGAPLLTEGTRRLPADIPVGTIRRERLGAETYYWEMVGTHEASYIESYGMPVSTLFDSTAASSEHHYFQVIAHTSDPTLFWVSDPDSGYSVDNLAPAQPMGLAGEGIAGPPGVEITWDPNTEADLSHYLIYRGDGEDFTPGPGNLVGTTADTILVDEYTGWPGSYYKVSAIDVHGNEGPHALLRPEDVSGGESPVIPSVDHLAQNHPNPFNPATSITYDMARPGHVRIAIFDVSGRPIATLIDRQQEAGRHTISWDGTNGEGTAMSSGVYFYMMRTPAYAATRKMVLLR